MATENLPIPERMRKVPTFDFNQKIQMNVMGKIGTRMEMRVNYNTEATFDYENKMNLGYTGDEDQIIKKIEAGNVSLPLNGSLITGGSNLFGVKAEMQFGKLNVTTIFSQNKRRNQGDKFRRWSPEEDLLRFLLHNTMQTDTSSLRNISGTITMKRLRICPLLLQPSRLTKLKYG